MQHNEHSSKCVIYISMIYLINIVTSTPKWLWQWQELKRSLSRFVALTNWISNVNFLLLIIEAQIFTPLLPLVLIRRWKCEKLLPNWKENCWAMKKYFCNKVMVWNALNWGKNNFKKNFSFMKNLKISSEYEKKI